MFDSAASSKINRDILREVFPVECELVGTENLADICAGELEFRDSALGSKMDVVGSIDLLASAITIVGFVWATVAKKPPKNLPVTPEQFKEIDELVVATVKESSTITGQKRREIYIAVTKRSRAVD